MSFVEALEQYLSAREHHTRVGGHRFFGPAAERDLKMAAENLEEVVGTLRKQPKETRK